MCGCLQQLINGFCNRKTKEAIQKHGHPCHYINSLTVMGTLDLECLFQSRQLFFIRALIAPI